MPTNRSPATTGTPLIGPLMNANAPETLYFTYWFPPSHRCRIVAGFMAAIPVSIGLGAPISTGLLELDGVLGIAGWRWLFLCEVAPAVIFGIATFFYLTDRPTQADLSGPRHR
jgi:MFS family permease